MNDLGSYFLIFSWILCLYGLVGGAFAGYKKNNSLLQSAASATVFVAITALISLAILAYGFITDDYSNQYIWQHSNSAMPWIYKFTAIWGGMDGSIHLWATILAVSSGIIAFNVNSYSKSYSPWLISILNSSTLFFLTITVFLTNPFRYLSVDFIPPDGNGLNPLLQNPYMAIHPPTLYLGFTTFAIPYAFCLANLIGGNINSEWIRLTRRWTLLAWGFLTAGIILGGHWAYIELGWGGFWAWDPVENSSFLPWLTGTAFIHSIMVQERKNMLKLWNVWLIVLTYSLTVFGTFLTRSGIVQSVHAFASTDIGWVFLLYLSIIIAFTIFLTFYRKKELSSDKNIESF
ncbi:UNVERIFIED_CONTAM: hypothetical protein GTU68_047165, partial [Idotea baltica]|nr:hypothetical protein [Idotea baltica]